VAHDQPTAEERAGLIEALAGAVDSTAQMTMALREAAEGALRPYFARVFGDTLPERLEDWGLLNEVKDVNDRLLAIVAELKADRDADFDAVCQAMFDARSIVEQVQDLFGRIAKLRAADERSDQDFC
jgi:hypothetical protein